MSPRLTAHHLAYGYITHTELPGNGSMGLSFSRPPTNVQHVRLGQLRPAMMLATGNTLRMKSRMVLTATNEALRMQPSAIAISTGHTFKVKTCPVSCAGGYPAARDRLCCIRLRRPDMQVIWADAAPVVTLVKNTCAMVAVKLRERTIR